MSKAFKVILTISILLAALGIWADGDEMPADYSTVQLIMEYVMGMLVITGGFFIILSAIYFSVSWLIRKINI